MHITTLTPEEALVSLNTSAAGLPPAEAARRLAEFGPNRVEEVATTPLALRFAREFTHFLALILWLAAALALFAEQEYRAERATAALRRLLPQRAKAVRDGTVMQTEVGALVPGDGE